MVVQCVCIVAGVIGYCKDVTNMFRAEQKVEVPKIKCRFITQCKV